MNLKLVKYKTVQFKLLIICSLQKHCLMQNIHIYKYLSILSAYVFQGASWGGCSLQKSFLAQFDHRNSIGVFDLKVALHRSICV